ncbi:carbohydrate-binding module family 50 protein [Canariomyces notabilis]|uniref:Carbohydrate-binding module family 50 protein n=1 Tax=Canariomyces notabilis TaxID=2074819 RepID=A0AAN6QCT7_9PEZI|nr:carbohydrate-binding module family 50 protein [Canariomyces arenarius]
MQPTVLTLLAAGHLPGLVTMVSAQAVSGRDVDCMFFTSPTSHDATCETFAAAWGLSVDDLTKLNPGIVCPGLDTSKAYCVIGTVTEDPAQTPTTTSAPSPSNSPAMPGLAENCDRFYKVASGDQCDIIAQKHGITTSQFLTWNSFINAECSNLWLGYYVCVHVPGATTTSSGSSQPTGQPSEPSPQMPGVVNNCKTFYLVKSGDSCWSIYTAAGITFDQLRSWNTQIDEGCTNLWLGYYICIRT